MSRDLDVEQLAIRVLGSKEAADMWMTRPQLGLDGRRPIDLIGTAPGTQLMTDLPLRMEAGIYT